MELKKKNMHLGAFFSESLGVHDHQYIRLYDTVLII